MNDVQNKQNQEMIIFKTADEKISVNVVMKNETAWLGIKQMTMLFKKS